MSDHYQSLGVTSRASRREIEDAYREICEAFNPAKFEGNELKPLAVEKLAAAESAFRILSDTRLRAQYDREIGIRKASSAETEPDSNTLSRALKSSWQTILVRLISFACVGAFWFIVKNPRIIIASGVVLLALWLVRKYRTRR